MTQTLALFVDAYRELNAKKLFWIVMALSGLIVASLACLGIDDKGLTVLWWSIELPIFSTQVIDKPTFYKLIFITVGVQLWLTWAATVLALVSTAGLIPDFVSSGAIELSLSKPIGRIRLFLTKYATGLLFAGLQVLVFSVGAFLVIGLRGGAWEPSVFLAVPLVVLFFSYLYGFCALVGLVTRSTVTALLTTIILWFVIFIVHTAETGVLLQFRITRELAEASVRSEVLSREEELTRIKANSIVDQKPHREDAPSENAEPAEPTDQAPASAEDAQARREAEAERIAVLEDNLRRKREDLKTAERQTDAIRRWHALTFGLKSVLPKTSETIELLNRWVIESQKMQTFTERAVREAPPTFAGPNNDIRISQASIARRLDEELRSRTPWWIIGTSLAFEAAVLALACGLFARKDF